MMSTKRRTFKSGRSRMLPVRFTAGIALFLAAGLAYLWLCGQTEVMGRMLKEAEQEQVALQRRFQNESFKWANLCSPESIDRALEQHGLAMGWPTRDQIIRLHDTQVDRTYSMIGMRGRLR